ncbi:DUF177 domain-containing protein [bacterium]|nr:MAG: DUF177 domain-containing protein [bacterium]
MILKLDDIPPEGLELEVDRDPGVPELIPFHPARPVKGIFTIRKTGSQVHVRGVVIGSLHQECSRCLSSYLHNVKEEFSIELRPLSFLGDGEELELTGDDLNVEFFRGEDLDLDHLLTEQLSLALPMKPLCSDECAGICSVCGNDRKNGTCSCDETGIDPRWKALEALKDRKRK